MQGLHRIYFLLMLSIIHLSDFHEEECLTFLIWSVQSFNIVCVDSTVICAEISTHFV